MTEEAAKLAALEEEYGDAVEDVRDARSQAGQPPDETEPKQSPEPLAEQSLAESSTEQGPTPTESNNLVLTSEAKHPIDAQDAHSSSKKTRAEDGVGETQMEDGG